MADLKKSCTFAVSRLDSLCERVHLLWATGHADRRLSL